MPTRPSVDYQGFDNPSVSSLPELATHPVARLDVHATPDSMGAETAKALGGLAKTGEDVGSQITDTAIKYQGMVNETLATNAETNYMVELGKKTANFRSKEGLAAVDAAPAYQADVATLRQQMRQNLPNGALRSFDMLAQRHEAYALNDSNLYVAQQIKQADLNSAKSQIEMSIQSAGSLPVAMDDKRFNDTLQDIHFGQGRQMQTQGWDTGTGMQQNTDGTHSFDESTPQGQGAKSVYQELSNKNVSAAWENRLKAIADNGNVMDSYQKYKDNYDQIPPEGRLKMDQYFAPKIKDFQARSISENTLSQHTTDYNQSIYGQKSSPYNIGNVKTAEGAAKNIAEFVQPATPEDGVIVAANNLRNNYQGLTLQQIGAKWAPAGENKTSDWVQNVSAASGLAPNAVPNLNDPAQLRMLVHGIGVAEKSSDDLGKFTPDVIESGVTKALAGAQPSIGQQAPNGKMVPSIADYYHSNYASILNNARDAAEQTHPGDIEFAEKTEAKTKQRMDAIITQQKMAVEAQQNTVLKALNGDLTNGTKPASLDQLIGISPEVGQAWNSLMVNNPKAAEVISNKMIGTKQDGKLGAGFSYLQQDALKGKLDANDLLYHVGDDLTQQGFDKLKGIIKPTPTPEERSESEQMATFLKYGHERILHSSLFHNTPEAEDAYQNWFSSVSKQIQQKQKDGAPLSTLIDPQSKDYVGGNMAQFAVPVQKQLSDRAARINEKLVGAQPISEDRKRQPGETPEQYLARIK